MIKPFPRCNTCRTRNCSVLSKCSADILDELSNNKSHLLFKKGERLVVEGEAESGIYFIRSGIAKIEVTGKNGQPLILRLAGAGTVFGHRVNSSNNKQPLSVVAVENVYVCHVSLAFYHQLVEKSPDLRAGMMQLLLDEIRLVEIHAVHLTHFSVKERIAGALLHIAKLYQYHPGGNGIHIQLERQDVADLAGTTREQVSRMLTELQQDALVKFRAKHFKFFDLNGLQAIAGIH